MLLKQLILIFFLLTLVNIGETINSPVFLWNVNAIERPTLPLVKQNEFVESLSPFIGDHAVVVFLEQNLTNKDFLCVDPNTQTSCFDKYLKQVAPKVYYANVEKPTDALLSIASETIWNTVNQTGKLQVPISCDMGAVNMIRFNDSINEANRAATLKLHDLLIASIIKNIQCPMLYIYMSSPESKSSKLISLSRVRRQPRGGPPPAEPFIFLTTVHSLMGCTEILYNTVQENKVVMKSLKPTKLSEKELEQATKPKNLVMTLNAANNDEETITFDVYMIDKYFTVKHAIIGDEKYILEPPIEVPLGFAYTCSTAKGYRHAPEGFFTITIKKFHIQFDALKGFPTDASKFGPSWDCINFFTPAILSGLFCMAIIIPIISWGVCMIMDTNAVDRFEDPKGPTLIILEK